VRVARDRRHFEHADGTPFFWLADTIWNGARVAEPKDFELYARVRASQKFTVAQWSVGPGEDGKKQAAFAGQDPVAINPQFFKRLEDKIGTLSRAGMVSAIAPLADLGTGKKGAQALPEYQAALVFRYMVARWGAEPVAWVLALEDSQEAGRWKKIGQAVFGEGQHAPVMLYAGGSPQLLDEFREENWVDIFGYRTVTGTRDAIKGSLTESPANEWQREPARPLICFTPCENGVAPQSSKRFSSDEVRQAAYGGLFSNVPAGISYEAQGVVDWDESHPTKGKAFEQLPGWHKALFMPAAKQMAHLGKFIDSIDFWRLRPEPKFIAAAPADGSPSRHAAALATEPNEIALVYVPEERTLELFLEALPPSPNVTWLNPRTGENSPAVAVVGGRTCQFPTPDPGDWLLVMKAGKQ